MLHARCHCGAVQIEVPRRPRSLTNCNCSICRRYGVLWAYYKDSEVKLVAPEGTTDEYRWGPGTLRFIRCKTDVGVAVILDKRIAEKGYGKKFLKSLPPMLTTRRIENITRFLEEAAYARAS